MAEVNRPEPPPPSRAGLRITASDDPAGGVLLIAIGALDYSSANGLVVAVQRAFDAGAQGVTADLAGIGFSDSSGLAALIRAHKSALHGGRRFTVRNPDHNLSRIFALTGLHTVLDITHLPPP
ncbi:STAS domain-containing protein [Dactylosporangium sp. NPDC051485]|uniref:STAS domain-containing protein n=1 Tax=Dactylosporangium sp. NPDC051485 TaxID=3154846 RepID=UPI00341E93C1